ncbi:MAG: YihA family ribosome biogenesis GTP-binding protein [Leptotrichiaceae bacterium]|nr:YihA family ribosome biogenesis GTP-binding protein [Leptotrichiaceae bacterium]MBP6281025.1 YihA family ribosome biogenesis GTP-binding protein [Leptotrichiaceae bacterium]MBP7100378.1 YihA family ribosome biogenesis GTP-binding protein [Leptotrichiaceae bacterium]MBP7725019.1 YihA family ribosome biogenesis GTP-binding protein [Leptotrichiaceae bacterium]MBP9629618.1 YihA family ribosome biogenesis GTP-binding protein [Leptotrichiaceae bacterium]
MVIKKSDFVKSAVHEEDYPEVKGLEFSFIGRSNVGKSSLINSLTGRRSLARTSKTPGRTQLINYFIINDEVYFVDLPGYGFAKVPETVKRNWGKTIETYLMSKRDKVVFLLLDLRRVPSTEDTDMLKWLEYYNIEYYIVFTKADKLSNNEKFKQLKEIRKKLVFKNEDVFFYSALKGTGKEELTEFIFKRIKKYNKSKK